jgi:hypothetical protein
VSILSRKSPSDRQRLDALYRADSIIIEGLRERVRGLEHEQERVLIQGGTVYGTPARIEWPEGRPFGYSDEQLVEMLSAALDGAH